MKIYIFAAILAVTLMIPINNALAATEVAEDGDTRIIFNRPVPNAEYKIGDVINFSGKIRVNSCGNGLFFNRVKFYITEDKEIPLTTAAPNVYNNCFGATSSNYENCLGVSRASEVQILDTSQGYKIYTLGTVFPPDITGYHGEGGFNWIEFNKNFTIPSDLGFHGPVRFYIEFSGTHWHAHWHWNIAYQKGTINIDPDAVIGCDNSHCGSGSSCSPSLIAYQPTSQANVCIYTLVNSSTPDDLRESDWFIKPQGTSDNNYQLKIKCSDPGLPCNYVLQNDLKPGDYTVKLEVKDQNNKTSDAIVNIHIATEIKADFKCSVSLEDAVWRNCNELSNEIMKNQKIYVKDNSQPSENASINGWEWRLNNAVIGHNNIASFNAENINEIKLTVTDTKGRSDYKIYRFNASVAPKWKEISSF